jgi:DNA-binding transcriptional MerR regulator
MNDLPLEGLEREVARTLDRLGLAVAQEDGRVSAVPDIRTIRYYTSLGLLDRPRIEGREARYSRRHVMQLVAIKALQAESLPLARIQERLYGMTDVELEALLAAASGSRKRRPPELREVRWREIAIEPGLKIVAQEGWSPRDATALEAKFRAAVNAFMNGGGR